MVKNIIGLSSINTRSKPSLGWVRIISDSKGGNRLWSFGALPSIRDGHVRKRCRYLYLWGFGSKYTKTLLVVEKNGYHRVEAYIDAYSLIAGERGVPEKNIEVVRNSFVMPPFKLSDAASTRALGLVWGLLQGGIVIEPYPITKFMRELAGLGRTETARLVGIDPALVTRVEDNYQDVTSAKIQRELLRCLKN